MNANAPRKLYSPYVSCSFSMSAPGRLVTWIDEATVTDIHDNGQPLLRCGNSLVLRSARSAGWYETVADAKRKMAEIIRGIATSISAQADEHEQEAEVLSATEAA